MPPLFSSPAFPSMKFMKNGIFGQETFVARRKTAFLDRKLLSLGEKWRFWTGNFCCSEKNGVFGQETFVARGRSGFFSIFKTSLPFITKKTTEAYLSPVDLFIFSFSRQLHKVDEKSEESDPYQHLYSLIPCKS